MSERPRLLELCAAEGGATRGYQQAGWRVIAVDIRDFGDVNPAEEFHVMDALDAMERFAGRVQAIHTSPPCQRWTHGNAANDVSHHPDLIDAHRRALTASGLPYVIENVPRAPLLDPVVLCGTMFDLTTTDVDGVELQLAAAPDVRDQLGPGSAGAPSPGRRAVGRLVWRGATRQDRSPAGTEGRLRPPSARLGPADGYRMRRDQ